MIKKKSANEARLRRHRRVRKKVSGTGMRPRLSVFRSGKHIYAQIIDDERMTTLVAASSREPDITRQAPASGSKTGGTARGAAAAKPAEAPSTTAKAGGEQPKGEQPKGKAKAAKNTTPEASAEGAGEKEDKLAPIADNRRVAQARLVGRLIAERAKGQGIEKIVFDRGGYLYHGRVAALAAGAREGGLDF